MQCNRKYANSAELRPVLSPVVASPAHECALPSRTFVLTQRTLLLWRMTRLVPILAQRAVAALPHDAHFMGIVLTALNALSTVHPEQNPALAGQNIYQSKEIQDKQIVRLIGARARAGVSR